MSRTRRSERSGCSIESRHGRLRLRFRWQAAQHSRATALEDTPENRDSVRKLTKAVAALVKAGRDPLAFLAEVTRPPDAGSTTTTLPIGPTVADYFASWIA